MALMTAALGMALAAAGGATAWVSPPAALHGVWFDADHVDVYCPRLLAASDPWEHDGRLLVGALWIDDEVLHQLAEYGEGNIHQVVRSTPVAPGQWQLEASRGIDVRPTLEQDGSFGLWLSLVDGVLVWHEQTRTAHTRAWRRCSDLPQWPSED